VFDPLERKIRRTLRRLGHQRVRLILPPDVLVIENAVGNDEQTLAALRTCWLRGWAELVQNAVPSGEVPSDGRISNPPFTRTTPVYRMTDSGWSVVHRSHMWFLTTVLIGLLSLLIALFASGILRVHS
jgi:hypothetical protein